MTPVPSEDGRRWSEAERTLEAGIDFEHANSARMYDYLLGGAHNFEVDREVARRVIAGNPEIAAIARANRAYLGRVVRWCVARGLDQFLDLGSGVPTVGNVHEIAHQDDPAARVAYVDFEPVAVAQAEALLVDEPLVTVTRADLRDPDSVFAAPGVAGLLDLTRPVVLLAIMVLHFVPQDPGPILAQYRQRLAPGSVVAISHASDDHDDVALGRRLREGTAPYNAHHGGAAATLRSRAELRALVDGLELVEPGLVDVRNWPDLDDHPPAGIYAAVAVAGGKL